MKKRLMCDCGNEGEHEIEFAYADGYAVGDRLLEGVNFKVWFDKEGKPQVEITEESKAYFEQLNQKMWLEAMIEWLEEADVLECPNCGHDCWIEE